MAQTENASRSRLSRIFKPFQLENAFLIFAIIYVPVSLLFMERGVVASVALIFYTMVLVLAGLLLMVRFLLFVARAANEHNGMYGSVFVMYVLNFLLPLLTFKFVAYTIWKMLPCVCGRYGLFADGVRMAKDIFYIFDVQQSLSWLVAGSVVMVAAFTLWSINRK